MKFALVTGASSGIGYSISIELAKSGFDVALASRSMSRLESLSDEISSSLSSCGFFGWSFGNS